MSKEYLDKEGLSVYVSGLKSVLSPAGSIYSARTANTENLVDIDYDSVLAFDTSLIISDDNNPLVGYATVGFTYVA